MLDPLLDGIASHHAGCLPAWKSLIEELFRLGVPVQATQPQSPRMVDSVLPCLNS